jgi:tetratricopeptide (TPR) repeat protein
MLNQTNGRYNSGDERWNKIMILRTGLLTWARSFDYLIWIDADAIVLNFRFHFDDLIARHPTADLIASSENFEILISNLFYCGGRANKINTGVLIVKNTQWSLDFLSYYWEHSDREKYHDQTVFDFLYMDLQRDQHSSSSMDRHDLMTGEDLVSHVVIVPPAILNTNTPVPLWFKPYQAVLHLLGEHHGYREHVLSHIFQAICSHNDSVSLSVSKPLSPPAPRPAPAPRLIPRLVRRTRAAGAKGAASVDASPVQVSAPSSLPGVGTVINNVVLNVTASRLGQWYLDTEYPPFLAVMNLLTEYTETFKTFPPLSPDQIQRKLNEFNLLELVNHFTHLSSRLTGVLVYSARESSSAAAPHLSNLTPDEFAEAFFLEPTPPALSYHGGDVLLLKAFRTLRNLIQSLRPLNDRLFIPSSSSPSSSPTPLCPPLSHERKNVTGWYAFLRMTSLVGGLYATIPDAPGVEMIFQQVQELYREVLSFPVAPEASPASTRSTYLRGLAVVQYSQLIHLKRHHDPDNTGGSAAAVAPMTKRRKRQLQQQQNRSSSGRPSSTLQLELEMEGNLLAAYEIYLQLAGRYGDQGSWMLEGMLSIVSCEVGKHLQAELYFEKARSSMSNLGERDFSLGILLKYRGECLLKMGRVQESEEVLKESLRIHRLNEIPLSHVTYQHLHHLTQLIQRQKRNHQREEGKGEVSSEL